MSTAAVVANGHLVDKQTKPTPHGMITNMFLVNNFLSASFCCTSQLNTAVASVWIKQLKLGVLETKIFRVSRLGLLKDVLERLIVKILDLVSIYGTFVQLVLDPPPLWTAAWVIWGQTLGLRQRRLPTGGRGSSKCPRSHSWLKRSSQVWPLMLFNSASYWRKTLIYLEGNSMRMTLHHPWARGSCVRGVAQKSFAVKCLVFLCTYSSAYFVHLECSFFKKECTRK